MVVGYVRLSRDEDKENYSSIISQKNIIVEYSRKRNWQVDKIYVDDNYSGYNFNRPGFSEMLKRIKIGEIHTVIVKDLSRIGRNNGKVLVFIDELREAGVRLILVEEISGGIDLLDMDSDIIGIKTWYNEMYVKDISRKVRASMHLKQKSGELIMGNFYGYKKIKLKDKFTLVPDENIKPIIQFIFRKYIGGLGYKKICDALNEKGCITPSEYIKEEHEKRGKPFRNAVSHEWKVHMINRIIQNDIYIGILRTRKREAKMIKGKQRFVPKEEQYVFKNHHEAIISEEAFELAQKINTKRRKIKYSGKAKYNYVFSSFIQCGECKGTLIGCNLRKLPKEIRGYNCSNYRRYGKDKCCNHAVKEEEILFFFKGFLREVRDEYEKFICGITVSKVNRSGSPLNKLEKELKEEKEKLRFILSQKIKDLMEEKQNDSKRIIEASYLKLEKEEIKKISMLCKKIKELQEPKRENNLINSIDIFDSMVNSETPRKDELERILDKIIVYKDRSLEFKLKVNINKLVIDK